MTNSKNIASVGEHAVFKYIHGDHTDYHGDHEISVKDRIIGTYQYPRLLKKPCFGYITIPIRIYKHTECQNCACGLHRMM
jgi:hypothetical protein